MENAYIHFDKFNHRMIKPFDSLVESIIEFNMEENSLNCSKGFENYKTENEPDTIRSYFEKCMQMVSSIEEGDSSGQVGPLDFLDVNEQGLYLIDPDSKKIVLFFFDQSLAAITIKEMLSKKDLVARINPEMFEALKNGEAGLDHEALVSLANMLIDSLPERLNSLAIAMKTSSWEEMKSQAHYLKSSFGVMGLERLSWLMTNLEIAAKKKDPQLALANYELLYPELILAVRFLRDEFRVGPSLSL